MTLPMYKINSKNICAVFSLVPGRWEEQPYDIGSIFPICFSLKMRNERSES